MNVFASTCTLLLGVTCVRVCVDTWGGGRVGGHGVGGVRWAWGREGNRSRYFMY